jgi:hypothetical protein
MTWLTLQGIIALVEVAALFFLLLVTLWDRNRDALLDAWRNNRLARRWRRRRRDARLAVLKLSNGRATRCSGCGVEANILELGKCHAAGWRASRPRCLWCGRVGAWGFFGDVWEWFGCP